MKVFYGVFYVVLFLSVHYSYSQNIIVHFDSGKFQLKQVDKDRIDSLFKCLDYEYDYNIRVVGHTDSVGTMKSNLRLSKNRALSVSKYIIKHNYMDVLNKTGKSFLIPLSANNTNNGRAINRRCELYVDTIYQTPAQWKLPVQVYKLSNQSKNRLETENNCSLEFDHYSFDVNNIDTVTVHITEYKDPTDFIVGGLPMSYSIAGRTKLFQSEQMMKIEAFVKGTPVHLLKKIKLSCPDVDTTGNLQLYKFRPYDNKWATISPHFIEKEAEVIESRLSTERKGDISDVREVESEKKEKQQQLAEVEKEEFVIDVDTGSIRSSDFVIEIDTGRLLNFYKGESGRICFSPSNSNCSTVKDIVCDSACFRKSIEYGLSISKIDTMPKADFTPYYSRYKDMNYDGLRLKCLVADSNTVKGVYRKRFLRRELQFRITSAPLNPEYLPLLKTKWNIYYGNEKEKAEQLKSSPLSDFRILPDKEQFNRFYIELKGSKSFYSFTSNPRRSKKTKKRYNVYSRLYEDRVREFNDSLDNQYSMLDTSNLVSLYHMMYSLSNIDALSICGIHTTKSCFEFKGFQDSLYKNCKGYTLCGVKRTSNCEYDCYTEWLKYYSENIDTLHKELTQVKLNINEIRKCKCSYDERYYHEWYDEYPCFKYKHTDLHDDGVSPIVYVGLGVYNFDRVFSVSSQQIIDDAVFLNQKGDTILKCNTHVVNYIERKSCAHEVYTIIPGFNGLLKQRRSTKLQLLLGKENILLFTKLNKRYKLYLDLREVKEFTGSHTFILKDITDNTLDIEGLRNELTIKE